MTPKENVMFYIRTELEEYMEVIHEAIGDGLVVDIEQTEEALEWIKRMLAFIEESEGN